MQRSIRLAVASLLVFLSLLAAAATVRPHDTWLLTLPGGVDRAQVGLSVRTGMDFPTSENAVAAANLSGWLVAPDGSKKPLPAFAEDVASNSSTCMVGPLAAGVHVACVDTQPKQLQLAAKKFNDYLLHDGLPHVLAARMDADEEGLDASEQYRKCAKVVFAVGDGGGGAYATAIGQRLEIVPLDDPTALAPRATLRVAVLFEGAPLPRANLCWDLPGNGEDLAGSTWTDARGEALVPIAQVGWMTVRLVHMTRPKAPSHEYESFWASCSFEVPSR
jgi:hypothetical protein